MKAIEFKSKIRNNQIIIPSKVQSEFGIVKEKNVRVIILIDDSEKNDEFQFCKASEKHFLEGYAESDSIYDNY
jgi:bifunctional DNA-binding transcriptional regulator/antitoxin component of YhaV-PrlF toxin-antitoxin module